MTGRVKAAEGCVPSCVCYRTDCVGLFPYLFM